MLGRACVVYYEVGFRQREILTWGIFRQFHGYVFLNVINCISVKLTELIIDLCYCPQAALLCMFMWT